jgi:hypothetical protein
MISLLYVEQAKGSDNLSPEYMYLRFIEMYAFLRATGIWNYTHVLDQDFMTTLETLPLKEKTELKPSSTNNLEVYQCF